MAIDGGIYRRLYELRQIASDASDCSTAPASTHSLAGASRRAADVVVAHRPSGTSSTALTLKRCSRSWRRSRSRCATPRWHAALPSALDRMRTMPGGRARPALELHHAPSPLVPWPHRCVRCGWSVDSERHAAHRTAPRASGGSASKCAPSRELAGEARVRLPPSWRQSPAPWRSRLDAGTVRVPTTVTTSEVIMDEVSSVTETVRLIMGARVASDRPAGTRAACRCRAPGGRPRSAAQAHRASARSQSSRAVSPHCPRTSPAAATRTWSQPSARW